MQKWEYLIIEVVVGLESERQKVATQINDLGRAGWELVTGTSDEGGRYVKLFFKRPQ